MSYGGGHRCGTGRRGATEFPAGWSADLVMAHVLDVARYPHDTPLRLPDGSWRTAGVRDGVRVVALLDPDGPVRAAYPVDGPGVVHNPDRAVDTAHPTVDDLADGRVGNAASELLARLPGRIPAELLALGGELYAVGEWDELGRLLVATAPELDDTERALLADLTQTAGTR